MLRLKPLDELFPMAKEKNIGVIARVPLASGLLTGRKMHCVLIQCAYELKAAEREQARLLAENKSKSVGRLCILSPNLPLPRAGELI